MLCFMKSEKKTLQKTSSWSYLNYKSVCLKYHCFKDLFWTKVSLLSPVTFFLFWVMYSYTYKILQVFMCIFILCVFSIVWVDYFQIIVEYVLRVDIFLGATHRPMCPDWLTGQVLTNHTAGKCGFPINPFTSLAFFQALSHSQRVSPPRLETLQQEVLLVRRNIPQFSSLPLPF